MLAGGEGNLEQRQEEGYHVYQLGPQDQLQQWKLIYLRHCPLLSLPRKAHQGHRETALRTCAKM